MFTVMFAIPRTSGWMAQWLEMVDDSEQKIARPRQIYTGGGPRDYVPMDALATGRRLGLQRIAGRSTDGADIRRLPGAGYARRLER